MQTSYRFSLKCIYMISQETMFLLTVTLIKVSAMKRKSKRLDQIWSAVKKIANSRPRQKRRFFFEISIRIQFSNPSHVDIEMYRMKAKNEYFLDCKLLCACQLMTSWEPLFLKDQDIWGIILRQKKTKTLQSCQLVDSRDALARKFCGAVHCSAT